jgi:long-chain acyl-CoA synthetase
LTIHTFSRVKQLGAAEQVEQSENPTAEDIATICYTIGTTAVLKSAVITQANCFASTYGVSQKCDIGTLTSLDKTDVYISYLPMAHVFERVSQDLMIYKG